MVKKSIILCLCAIMYFTGCASDPYSGERPADYGEFTWISSADDYMFCFNVDFEQEEYQLPEGELELHDTTYFCKFYFIHQTNQLSISVYPLEYKDIPDSRRDRRSVLFRLHGECDFSPTSFVVHIDKSRDTVFNGKIDKLIFVRTELTIE